MFNVEEDFLVFDINGKKIWASLCWNDVISDFFDALSDYLSDTKRVVGVSVHSEPSDSFFVFCHGQDDTFIGVITPEENKDGLEEMKLIRLDDNQWRDIYNVAKEFVSDVEGNYKALNKHTKNLDANLTKLKKMLCM